MNDPRALFVSARELFVKLTAAASDEPAVDRRPRRQAAAPAGAATAGRPAADGWAAGLAAAERPVAPASPGQGDDRNPAAQLRGLPAAREYRSQHSACRRR